MARIGVEESLTDIKNALAEMGHEVVELHSAEDAPNCDCCVITGLDKDVMGMSTISTEGSVINAEGRTAQDVVQMVNQRLNDQQ
ncbi:YkuS family protein [Virgibacillus kekensis]|uniref:UPF0180 protein ACFO3D_01825 n=1 Tax=Virgibacillus kekensis TaxID=202261 RepID=A0ABV9DDS8_9BACI